MSRNPFEAHSAEEMLKAKAERSAETILAHGRLWNTADGKMVLADLMAKFGYHRMSATHTTKPRHVYLNEGMKAPLHYIETMKAMAQRGEQKAKPKRVGEPMKKKIEVEPQPRPE